jgi:uncharacterized protein (TIGR02598 family)
VKLFSRAKDSFSLIELTLALGVVSFCLIAVFGLLPVGIQTSQEAISETASASILSAVIAACDARNHYYLTTIWPHLWLPNDIVFR